MSTSSRKGLSYKEFGVLHKAKVAVALLRPSECSTVFSGLIDFQITKGMQEY